MEKDMQSKVEKFIRDKNLLKDNSTVILGVSGGADSVVLLDVLYKAGYQLVVAHCNFHLRAEESMRDEVFVRQISKDRNLTCRVINFDTVKYAEQHSISIEMAARELRYGWFEELRQEADADAIAVAHHKDDSAETVVMNLIRGTGIRGLTGIKPQAGYIVRPLLCVSRIEIEEYAYRMGLEYIDDSTNRESIYTRNIIRLDIIPYFERINPSAKEAIQRTMKNLGQVENIYKEYIETSKKKIFKENSISIKKLKQLTEPEAVLFEILSEYNFNAAVISDIYDGLDGLAGKIFYSNTHKVLKDRDFLLIDILDVKKDQIYEIVSDTINEITTPINLKIQKIELSETFELDKKSDILYVDYDLVSYPLILRRWVKGDWFIPFGMEGKKKLSDYFSDNKFSLFDKENVWLLCSGDNILWIIGHRADNRFKVSPNTKTVLKVEIIFPKHFSTSSVLV